MDALTFGATAPAAQPDLHEEGKTRQEDPRDHASARAGGPGLTNAQFVDFCILCGCDYSGTIRGVGPKTALKLIKEHGSIEEILRKGLKAKDKANVPANWLPPDQRVAGQGVAPPKKKKPEVAVPKKPSPLKENKTAEPSFSAASEPTFSSEPAFAASSEPAFSAASEPAFSAASEPAFAALFEHLRVDVRAGACIARRPRAGAGRPMATEPAAEPAKPAERRPSPWPSSRPSRPAEPMATEPTTTAETPAAKRPSEDASDDGRQGAQARGTGGGAGGTGGRGAPSCRATCLGARQLWPRKHEVTPAADVQLEWRKPDEAKLREFLIEKMGFNADRVEGALKKLVKAQARATP